jgi:hypothetical protein
MLPNLFQSKAINMRAQHRLGKSAAPPARLTLALAMVLTTVLGSISAQANIIKQDTTAMNNATTTDWNGATGAGVIGEFDGTASATSLANMTLGGSISLGGLQFDSTMQGPLTIATGSTLTLTPATSTVTLEAGCPNVTINCAMAEANLASTWTVTSAGTTLTVPTPGFGTSTWTFNGAGNFNFYPGNIQTGNGSGAILVNTTGSFNVNDITIYKYSGSTATVPTALTPVAASTTVGFSVPNSGSTVTLNTMELSTGNSG